MSIIDGNTRLLGVIGYPVSHSKSPLMHNALLGALNINAVYVPLSCPPEGLSDLIRAMRHTRFIGANVTIPHKESVLALVDELTPVARFMGSVNTLYWEGDKLCGTTTDPYGALMNLREHGVSLRQKSIALLGTGGAARALAFALLSPPLLPDMGVPRRLTIFARDPDKAKSLGAQLRKAGLGNDPPLDEAALQDFQTRNRDYDLLINCTSVGMAPAIEETPVPAAALHPGLTVYDIVYNPRHTRLLNEARTAGCPIIEGIGMLIHQGALSFSHWFPDIKPDIAIMRRSLSLE